MGPHTPGVHASNTSSDGTVVILDGCLSYIKYLMGSESKLSIQNIACAKFDFNTLKASREKLYKTVSPEVKYVYTGPRSASTEAEKSVHALEGILTKLHQLEQSDKTDLPTYMFACPRSHMESILNAENQAAGDEIQRYRLNKIELDVNELKSMKAQMDDMKSTLLAVMMSQFDQNEVPSAPIIQHDSEFPPIQRDRSSSVQSYKRPRASESDSEKSTDPKGFHMPRNVVRKSLRSEKKAKMNPTPVPSFSDKLKSGTPKPTDLKKKFQWGKSSEESSVRLQGVIPDIFVTRCSLDTQPEQLVNHLKEKGSNVKNIQLKSREEANFKSFKLSVFTSQEYDKVICGEPLPPRIQVRPWIYYRNNSVPQGGVGSFKPVPQATNMSKLSQDLAELQHLENNLSAAMDVTLSGSLSNDVTPVTSHQS